MRPFRSDAERYPGKSGLRDEGPDPGADKAGTFRFEFSGCSANSMDQGSATRVDFRARTYPPIAPLTKEQFGEELTALHDLILRHFEATFTPSAKESFKLLPSPCSCAPISAEAEWQKMACQQT